MEDLDVIGIADTCCRRKNVMKAFGDRADEIDNGDYLCPFCEGTVSAVKRVTMLRASLKHRGIVIFFSSCTEHDCFPSLIGHNQVHKL